MFTVEYDTLLEDLVSTISIELLKFDLTIDIVEEGDGFIKYEIKECKSEEKNKKN